METRRESPSSTTRPDPKEAAAALRQIDRDRASMEFPPVPGWYYPILAALMAAAMLGQLLPSPGGAVVSLIMVLGCVVLARVYVNKVGVLSWLRPRQAWLPVTLVLVATFGAILLDQVYGLRWGWIVAAAVDAAAVLGFGIHYRRVVRDRS